MKMKGSVTRPPAQKFLADGSSQLAIIRIVVNRAMSDPNGGERLVHHCQSLRTVYVESGFREAIRSLRCCRRESSALSHPVPVVARTGWFLSMRLSDGDASYNTSAGHVFTPLLAVSVFDRSPSVNLSTDVA